MQKKLLTAAKLSLALFFVLIIQGCSTFQIQPIDFGWPVEEVLSVDAKGLVSSTRYSFSFPVQSLVTLEQKDGVQTKIEKIRILRNIEGYYFVTAQSFKNVYVFTTEEGKLVLVNTILVNQQGLKSPVMNQRSPLVELIDGSNAPIQLTSKGIFVEKK